MLAVLGAGIALAAAGCGGGDESPDPSLPPESVAKLNERLDVVQRQLNAGGGACSDIANTTRPVIESDLEALPDSVDADTRKALNESFDRLFQLVDEQCDTATETTPTTTQETETTPTETQETQTQETQTQATTPTTPEKPNKPDKPQGGGGNNGGGGDGDSGSGGAGFGEGD